MTCNTVLNDSENIPIDPKETISHNEEGWH